MDDVKNDNVETVIWLNTDQVAERLGVSLATLYRYLNHGDNRLPSYKISRGVIRIKQSELDEWVASHKF